MKRAVAVLLFAFVALPAMAQRWYDELPACSQHAAASRKGWTRVVDRFKQFDVQIPPSFVADPHPRYIHGGDIWRDGDRRLTAAYGVWGLDSFGPGSTKCQAEVGGERVVFVTIPVKRGVHELAWFVDSGSGTQERRTTDELLFGVGSPNPRDRAVFYAFVESIIWNE